MIRDRVDHHFIVALQVCQRTLAASNFQQQYKNDRIQLVREGSGTYQANRNRFVCLPQPTLFVWGEVNRRSPAYPPADYMRGENGPVQDYSRSGCQCMLICRRVSTVIALRTFTKRYYGHCSALHGKRSTLLHMNLVVNEICFRDILEIPSHRVRCPGAMA